MESGRMEGKFNGLTEEADRMYGQLMVCAFTCIIYLD